MPLHAILPNKPGLGNAKLIAATDAQWGGGFMSPKQFIGLVYQGV